MTPTVLETALDVEVDVDVEDVAVDVEEELVVVFVPFCAFAAAWNAVKFLVPLSTALIAMTIPIPQWSTGEV